MNPLLTMKKPEELSAVEKSIAKPGAFSKPGTYTPAKGVRFRPMSVKRPTGPQRKRKADPRKVHFF